MTEGEQYGGLDEAFVAAAAVREAELRGEAPLPPPSKASLREVKREARQRRRARQPVPEPVRKRPRGLVLLALGLVVLGAGAYAVSGGAPDAPAAGDAPVVVPSYTPPPSAPHDHFAGSKVAAWPVGAAGIKPPAPRAVGAFNRAQVADAYDAAVRYLKTAMLDRRVVWDGALEPVYGTLSPDSVRRRRRQPRTVFANRFPRGLKAASSSVRVNGSMRAKRGSGGLLVEFSYVATYAVRQGARGPVELVAVRRAGTLEYLAAGPRTVGAPGLLLSRAYSDHAPCGMEWPHPDHLTVVLGDAGPSAPPTEGPTESFNFLDPRADDPVGSCFTNTGQL